MVTREQETAVCYLRHCAVSELRRSWRQPKRSRCGDVGDLPERDHDSNIRQGAKRHLEIGAACRDLTRLGLVCGRQAFDRIEDDCTLQLEAITGIGTIFAV